MTRWITPRNPRPQDFYLIETMRHCGHGVVKSLDAHLARAGESARHFGFVFDPDRVRAALVDRLAASPEEARIRLSLFDDGRIEIEVSASPSTPSWPLRLALHPEPMDTTACWSRHKTSLRRPYDRRRESLPNFDDVIVMNERGELMETCTGNLVVMVDGIHLTPPLESGCLPGIERRALLDDGTLREETLTRRHLREATSIAVVNSLRGWRTAIFMQHSTSRRDRVTV